MTQIDQDQIGFHEAVVTAISRRGSDLRIKLEDVLVNDANKSMEVKIEGVETVEQNGVIISDIRLEKTEAELLRLKKQDNNHVILVIEWKDYAARKQDIVVYDLRGSKINLKIESI